MSCKAANKRFKLAAMFVLLFSSPTYSDENLLLSEAASKHVSSRDQLNKVAETSGKVFTVFGENLFKGGYEAERFDGLNEDYVIAPGDKVSIEVWGTKSLSTVATVDNQGNVFIPDVGPVRLQGVKASDINVVVTSQIRTVYKDAARIYVNLLNATPVSVFVTGGVDRPGQYAGMASDSLLYFLNRAGGIDSLRGSYRSIKVLRDSKVVFEADLYEFLRAGKIAHQTFKDRDVILVSRRGAVVAVEGSARYPFEFELNNDAKVGADIIELAMPVPSVSHAKIDGTRDKKPLREYLSLQAFSHKALSNGDKVTFVPDQQAQMIDITLKGSYLGPSHYVVKQHTTLQELLDNVAIDQRLADASSIYIQRISVAKQQQQLLNDSLDRLERSLFTAPASSDGEASIRAKEAELVMQFVNKARSIKPLGKVIVSSNQIVGDLRLEDGDRIVIPERSQLVQIGGEVVMPQAVLHNANIDAEPSDYVAWAGGFTERADVNRIGIIRASGEIDFGSSTVNPGDQILVMPRVDAKTMQNVKDITQIIYQVAVAANVVL